MKYFTTVYLFFFLICNIVNVYQNNFYSYKLKNDVLFHNKNNYKFT